MLHLIIRDCIVVLLLILIGRRTQAKSILYLVSLKGVLKQAFFMFAFSKCITIVEGVCSLFGIVGHHVPLDLSLIDFCHAVVNVAVVVAQVGVAAEGTQWVFAAVSA